jgi:predicted nucleotidyltransferase
MTGRIGLSVAEVDLICGVLRRHVEVTGALLFGSRAKGTSHQASDVDLALPYRFDVQAFAAIQNPPLREYIERVGVKIYG